MDLKYGIPVVDFSDFISGDLEKKNDFIRKLGNAYEEIGFVAVKNHGVSPNIINSMYQQMASFFSLPEEIKKKYEISPDGKVGYTSFGREHAKGSKAGDLKEFWHFGQFPYLGEQEDLNLASNVMVKEVPDFLTTGQAMYRAMEGVGIQILRAISLFLNLDEFFFDEWVHGGISILRPIHYPPIIGDPKGSVRAGAHEDINLITLLVGASAEGLEVLNKKGEWVPVTAIEDFLVVNVGDMLQRLTNNKLRSTTHRVVNPPKEKWNESRYSVPFFLHPKPEMSLACLPQCIDSEHPKLYEDVTSGEYLDERLKEIGLK